MRADDEPDDPLDRWLSQQVTPLQPPLGTFELISRRARRRRARGIAITLVSAAAVVVAIAVAVPAGFALRLAPPSSGGSLAGGPATTGSGTQSANGTASRVPAADPATATHPATEPSGPVPASFAPTSVTFVSTSLGWVIGQAGTPGSCADANPYICTSVARTDNAGRTWEGGPAPRTTGPNGPTGVGGIRFLDGVNGWAFGPELWATNDAGNTWSKIATNGQRVTDLEAVGDRAFALWAYCPDAGASPGVAAGCTHYTLMSSVAGTRDWAPVGTATTGLAGQGNPASASLALTGTAGYLLAPDGTLYAGPVSGGAWQRAGTSPCRPGTAQPDGLPSGALLAAQDAAHLVIACSGPSFPGGIQVFTSGDGGARWAAQPAAAWQSVPAAGPPASLAAAPDGTRLLATATGLYVQPAGASRWRPAVTTGTGGPAGGFSYVGMTTDAQGVALPADTSLHEIWLTFDGGTTWRPSPVTG